MNNIVEKKNSLKTLVAEDKINELFDEIEGFIFEKSKIYDDFVLLKGRFQFLSKQILRNTLQQSDIEIELNKIRQSLISVIDEISEKDILNQTKVKNLLKVENLDLIEINERIELLSNEKLHVKFDNSPDGLQRVISINTNIQDDNFEVENFREHGTIFDSIKSIEDNLKTLNNLKDFIFLKQEKKKKLIPSKLLGSTMESILKSTVSLLPLRNTIISTSKNSTEINYVIEQEIHSYYPKTIFSQLIGDESALDKIYESLQKRNSSLARKNIRRTLAMYIYEEEINNQKEFRKIASTIRVESQVTNRLKGERQITNRLTGEANNDEESIIYQRPNGKRLSLNIDSDRVNLINFLNSKKENFNLRPILDESLLWLKPKYRIEKFNQIKNYGELTNREKYEIDLYTSIRDYKNDFKIKYSFQKKRFLSGFLNLITEIKGFHSNGVIHGDLSPKNILLLKKGLHPIDSLDIEIGEISTFLTPNYCAPEQIVKQEVDYSTDIYNMGLLLLSFFKGTMFGKLENFVFPNGNGSLVNGIFISKPEVFIKFEKTFSKNLRKKWIDFFDKCFRLNQKERFNNLEEFGNKFEDVFCTRKLTPYGTRKLTPPAVG